MEWLPLSPVFLGLAGHATHFVVLPMLGAMLCLINACANGRRSLFFFSGLLFGIAFIMKQQGVFFGIFGGVWVLWNGWNRKPREARRLLSEVSVYSVGAIIPFGLVCLILWHAGVFHNFWFWTVEYARHYVGVVTWTEGLNNLKRGVHRIVVVHWPMAVLAAAGAVLLWWKRPVRGVEGLMTGFLAFSALAVCPDCTFASIIFCWRYRHFACSPVRASAWARAGWGQNPRCSGGSRRDLRRWRCSMRSPGSGTCFFR